MFISVASVMICCWQHDYFKYQSFRVQECWLSLFLFPPIFLGHSTSLLGLQTRRTAHFLQTGRLTGKVTQAESPPFPPRALLEVSWVCEMSWGHKTANSQPLLEDNGNLKKQKKIGGQFCSLITHRVHTAAQWWKPSSSCVLMKCWRVCTTTVSAPGSCWDIFPFFCFHHSVSFPSLLRSKSHHSKFDFDVILPVILHWSQTPVWILFEVLFLTFSPFFLNECNCCTSNIVHFHCLVISSVCQICGPFCERYLMTAHVCLYCWCRRSCVSFRGFLGVFSNQMLSVHCTIWMCTYWSLDQPGLWKRPRNSAFLNNIWGKKVVQI